MKCSPSLRHDIKFSNRDSFLFSVMVGAGETFLPAFVLALGLSQIASGLVAALPFLAAATLQLAAPWGIARVGSFRKWLTSLAVLQGLCFLPLCWGAWRGSMPSAVVFGVVTLYWTCGLASGPAWNSWMCSLIPMHVRPRYFAIRSRLGQVGLLLGLVTAGVLLEISKRQGRELFAFAVLFAVSGIFRLVSGWCLSRQTERPKLTAEQKPIAWRELLKRVRHSRDGRLILFLAIFQTAVNISSPFFNPFMLRVLEVPYWQYMVLVAASFVTKIVVFPHLGTWGKRVGPFRLMQISVVATAMLPVYWMISDNFLWLVFSQMVSGISWAIFELGMMLALFETIRDDERTGFMSFFNFVNALAVVAGTLAGAYLLRVFGETHSTYGLIFAISTAARLLCSIVLERTVLRPEERRMKQATLAILAMPKRVARFRARPRVPRRDRSRIA